MLKDALKARIPLITIRTSDPISVPAVLHHYTGRSPYKLSHAVKALAKQGDDGPREGAIFLGFGSGRGIDGESLYMQMADNGWSAVIVNPSSKYPMLGAYDAGEMTVPAELLAAELVKAGIPADSPDLDAMCKALEGLTPLESRWVIAFAGRDLSLRAIRAARAEKFPPTRGLQAISSSMDFYIENEQLTKWLAINGAFLEHPDRRLRPRGLLFDGPPGTGKTMGAKFIAQELGLPLYRFNIGALKNKYVGESERFMREALQSADRHSPCVLLLDEVEKIFDSGQSHGDSGTTTSLLAELLWWLQEHKSPVFVVMTTNAKKKLPPELYRPGRIDAVMVMDKLKAGDEVVAFVESALDDFDCDLDAKDVAYAMTKHTEDIAHADAYAGVVQAVKAHLLGAKKRFTIKKGGAA